MAQLVLQGVGPADPATGANETLFLATIPVGVTTDPEVTAGHSIRWDGIGAWSGMVIRSDPGQPLVWLAFGLLIVGLVLTFYFPRRRAWARIEDGRIGLAFLADRYVDKDREFGQLRDEVERRTGGDANQIPARREDTEPRWTRGDSTPHGVDRSVHRESVQPGVEVVRIAQPGQVAPGAHQGLLDGISREVRVPEDDPGDRVQPRDGCASSTAKAS